MACFYFDAQTELLSEVVKRNVAPSQSYLDNEFSPVTIAPSRRRDK